MRNIMKKAMVILLACMLAVTMVPAVPAAAKSKSKKIKLTVNTFEVGNRKIKGKITKNGKKVKKAKSYRVVARVVKLQKVGNHYENAQWIAGPKVGKYKLKKKKYTAKVRKNGTFTIKGLPKLKVDRMVKVSLYKGKKFKRSKVIPVQYKNIKITKKFWNNFLKNTLPAKVKLLKKAKKPSGNIKKDINGYYIIEHEADGKTPYYMVRSDGSYVIGNPDKYYSTIHQMESCDDPYGEMKSLNGATIYVNTLFGGDVTETYQLYKRKYNEGVIMPFTKERLEKWYQRMKPWDWKGWDLIPDPTNKSYQYKINPGGRLRINISDYPDLEWAREGMYYKVSIYIKGKFVAAGSGHFNHFPAYKFGYKVP